MRFQHTYMFLLLPMTLVSVACEIEDEGIVYDYETEDFTNRSSFGTSTSNHTSPECPELWRFPLPCESKELDGRLTFGKKSYDVDFEMTKQSSNEMTGVFDGPYAFNGSFSATREKDGAQSLSINASGHGYTMDVTLEMDKNCDASLSGFANGKDVTGPVSITGTGTLKDPFTVVKGDVKLEWTTDCGEISKK